MSNNCTRTTYNKVVGRAGDEYYILEDIFCCPAPLFSQKGEPKGATGIAVIPVTQEEIDVAADQWLAGEYDFGTEIWQEAVGAKQTAIGLGDWLQEAWDSDGPELVFDLAGDWADDALRKVYPGEFQFAHCVRCGRIFDAAGRPSGASWDEVFRPDLVELIAKAES